MSLGKATSYFWLDFVNLLRFLRWRCLFAAIFSLMTAAKREIMDD